MTGAQAPETAAATLVRVKDHILRHLADPGLAPPQIAAAHCGGRDGRGVDPHAATGAVLP
ncbi:hypothetical protein [Streptomyces luteogriseus]|uniref:hypothetical protein n=1 Tax=Streptomyces luteogriseus TaxID=68233 RepID=UPI002E37EFC2|nr:hypothetical protein [Streptomyces luteogriseus]WTJ33468.1 hypothetical protein OID52_36185 [Streptomyces luteogriseus]